ESSETVVSADIDRKKFEDNNDKKKKRTDKNHTQRTADVNNHKPRFPVIHGEGDKLNDDTSAFSAAEKKAWIYVGRCNKNSTAEGLEAYLRKKLPRCDNFDISKISKSDASYASFKVGLCYSMKDDVMDPKFWLKGVLVKRFKFFRHSNPTAASTA